MDLRLSSADLMANEMNSTPTPTSTPVVSTPTPTLPPTEPTQTAAALEQLASIDLIELCSEARIERCRATRDLSSCGRYVQHVLNSCGHASLCAECCQRCDVCPICRTSIPNNGTRVRLRLYYKCIEAGLISKRHDERFQEKDDSRVHTMADIHRLYSLFDVALENNLVSLICHYVTDVCMDENAVSSDPVLAFLLDEVVVKDWCKEKFLNIIHQLQGKYGLGVEEMKSELGTFQKLTLHLAGISNVLEIMVNSFKETFSGPVDDLHHLLESTLKAKQHLEIMIWCIRHHFLDDVQSRYPHHTSWILHFHERKAAALKRAWPDNSSYTTDSSQAKPTLFIEEALSNLGIEQVDPNKREELDLFYLQDENSFLYLQSNIDDTKRNEEIACYPFENLRVASDILFLHGSSDMVVAKRAIFLYYLFDRQWTVPDAEWRHLIDDFAASFGISRQSVLESLTFYLLDDASDLSVQEAVHLLSEIAGPETHPKVAQILLEHQRPDAALTVMRCSGRDGISGYSKTEHDSLLCTSLNEAITAIRVRIECGLLTEAFMYQRQHCSRMKELAFQGKSSFESSRKTRLDSWINQVEILVTEICQLCIRRNLVDRMIELPWNSDEENFLHKCLFGHACQNPASINGSLLVVFYLQRYRYVEADQVDSKLQVVEQKFLETATGDVVCRINSISQWRSGLVGKGMELLPKVQKQQAMAERAAVNASSFSQDGPAPFETHSTDMLSSPVSIFTTSSAKPSVLQKSGRSFPSRRYANDVSVNFSSGISNAQVESGRKTSSFLQSRLLSSLGSSASRLNSSFDRISSSNAYNSDRSPSDAYNSDHSPSDDVITEDAGWADVRRQYQSAGHTLNTNFPSHLQVFPPADLKGSVSKVPLNGQQFQGENAVMLNRVPGHAENVHENHHRMEISHSNGFAKELIHSRQQKNLQYLSRKSWNGVFSEEATLNAVSSAKRDSPVDGSNTRGGSRWRSDESSEDEADHMVEQQMGSGTPTHRRRARYSRR